MYTVTQRIKSIKQPYGGYIKPKDMVRTQYNDGNTLNENESITPQNIGVIVDYLTRLEVTGDPFEAFDIPLLGANYNHGGNKTTVDKLLKKAMSKDPAERVIAACGFIPFDTAYRLGFDPIYAKTPKPDKTTIQNIIVMVNRGTAYLKEKGIVKAGFYMTGGYTDTISCGDGDYLTNDAVVDFKVSHKHPTTNYTLQVLVYYLLGLRSIFKEFKSMKRLALFNPRKNLEYSIDIKDIPQETITAVCSDVINCEKIVTANYL